MPHPPECLAANPDVSGIGIRISFYVNTILIAAVPRHPPFTRLLEPLETNNGLNGLALLVTAVAQSASSTSTNSLSLYHAIIVLHMLTFLGLAASTTGTYTPTRTRIRLIAITSWCAMVAFFYLTLRVWITAPTFGSQPQCNDWTVYVLFGVSVRATSQWLRWLIVSLVCLAIIKFVVTTTRTLVAFVKPERMLSRAGTRSRTRSYYNQSRSQSQNPHLDPSSQQPHENGEAQLHESPAQSLQSITTTSTAPPNLLTRILPTSSFGRKRQSVFARVFASIYSVIMLELTIRRNPSSDQENVWSFGQIIALLITLMTVNEIVHFVLGEDLGLDVGSRVDELLWKIRSRFGRRARALSQSQNQPKEDVAPKAPTEDVERRQNGVNGADLELGARKERVVSIDAEPKPGERRNKGDYR